MVKVVPETGEIPKVVFPTLSHGEDRRPAQKEQGDEGQHRADAWIAMDCWGFVVNASGFVLFINDLWDSLGQIGLSWMISVQCVHATLNDVITCDWGCI